MEAWGGRECFELFECEVVRAAEAELGHGGVGPVVEDGVGEVEELLFGEVGEGVVWRAVRRRADLCEDVGERLGGCAGLGVGGCVGGACGEWCCDHGGIVADGRGCAMGKWWMCGKLRTDAVGARRFAHRGGR